MGWLTLSNFASKIFVFLLVPLYTSVLTPKEYGLYDLSVSTVFLMYPILTVNITDAVMRFSMDKTYSKNMIALIGIRYILGSIGIAGLFLIIIRYYHLIPDIQKFEIYIFLYYLTYVLNQFFIQLAKGFERVFDMGIAGLLGTLVMLVINILCLLVFKLGLPGFFIANILSQIVPAIYLFRQTKFWKLIIHVKIDHDIQNEMFIYSLPLICTTIGWWINSVSDKYVVAFMCGISANGLLSVAYKMPAIINTLQGIFIQAWQISAIKEYGGKDTFNFYGTSFLYLSITMSIACSILIILSKPLAHLLYANDFFSAWRYVPFLLISSVLNSASGFIGPILSAKKDSKSMAISAIYGAVINLVLNVVLVYLIGIQGATIATVISSYVIYSVRKHAASKELKIDFYRVIIFTWAILCIQAVVEIYTAYWKIEIIFIAIILWINLYTLRKSFIANTR